MAVSPGVTAGAALFCLADVDRTQNKHDRNGQHDQQQGNGQIPIVHHPAEEAAHCFIGLVGDIFRHRTGYGCERDEVTGGNGLSLIDGGHGADGLPGLKRRFEWRSGGIADLHFDFRYIKAVRQQHADVVLRTHNDAAASLGVEHLGHSGHGCVGEHLHEGKVIQAVFQQFLRLCEAFIRGRAVVVFNGVAADDDAQKMLVAVLRGRDQAAARFGGKARLDARQRDRW